MNSPNSVPAPGEPGARIEMEGMLNLRDLGGWQTPHGPTRSGAVFRSDRLSDLTENDHMALDDLGISTVIDLRSDIEVNEDRSRLWPAVKRPTHFPIGGDAAQQKSFIERVLDGEFDEITDAWVGETYVEMLIAHPTMFGQAVATATGDEPALFHCTAGKDRTGLVAMMLLSTVGVSDEDILTDFTLSNSYRANTRMTQLAPTFAEKGLDIEQFRPALSAPRPAMVHAMAWLRGEYESIENFLTSDAGLAADDITRIRAVLTP